MGRRMGSKNKTNWTPVKPDKPKHRGRKKGVKNVSTLEREAREWAAKNTLAVSWSLTPIPIEQEVRKGDPLQHDLKTWPKPFRAILQGLKLFEFRVNDRGFMVGDVLRLREWNPDNEKYTGKVLYARVNYILEGGKFGLPKKFVVMSIDLCMVGHRTLSTSGMANSYDPNYSFGTKGGASYGD